MLLLPRRFAVGSLLGQLSYNLNTSAITALGAPGLGIPGLINGRATTDFKGSIVGGGVNYRFC